jgi:hypothetical protein
MFVFKMVFFPFFFFGSTRYLSNLYENISFVSIREQISRSEVSDGIGRKGIDEGEWKSF